MHISPPLTQLSRIALLVAAGDLATKWAAKALLSEDPTRFAHWLHLAVVHNRNGAFGWSVGAYTWQLNLALTIAGIVFMVPVSRDLAKIDRAAPLALGLIVGGALGNLASLVTSPDGVVDFISLQFETVGVVLNAADVAAYVGLAMILRTGTLIIAAMRHEGRYLDRTRVTPLRSVFAEQASLRRSLELGTLSPGPQLVRDVGILDWSDVSRTPALVADGATGEPATGRRSTGIPSSGRRLWLESRSTRTDAPSSDEVRPSH